MEMAPKGLYKISIPSKPIKIVHAISLQNDSPQPYFFAHFHHLSPRTPSTKWQPSQCINFCHLFTLWFWAGEKTKGILQRNSWHVGALELQNDKPGGCPNKHPYKMANLRGVRTTTSATSTPLGSTVWSVLDLISINSFKPFLDHTLLYFISGYF